MRASRYKSRAGRSRLLAATRHSIAGQRAAFRYEAAFWHQLVVGIPRLLATPWLSVAGATLAGKESLRHCCAGALSANR